MLRRSAWTWQSACLRSRWRTGTGTSWRDIASRARSLTGFFARRRPLMFVMEACGTAHFWARCAREHGHQVSLLPAQYVPSVRAPQQDRPHRRRRAARGRRHATPRAPPACPRPALRRRARDGASDRHPRAQARARRFASWLGLTPSERSSGARRRLGAISKQGDVYLRCLLTHGARAVLLAAHRQAKAGRPLTRLQQWALTVRQRRGHNKTAVAVANKLARIIWAV